MLLGQCEGGSNRGWQSCGQAAAHTDKVNQLGSAVKLFTNLLSENNIALPYFPIPNLTYKVSCAC